MTGFDSKRRMAQDKQDDEADTLTIVYQRGFADGKRSAQRKPLTDEMRKQMLEASNNHEMRGAFANGWLSAEAAHNNWPFPTELPKPQPSKPIPFNPNNHEDAPW